MRIFTIYKIPQPSVLPGSRDPDPVHVSPGYRSWLRCEGGRGRREGERGGEEGHLVRGQPEQPPRHPPDPLLRSALWVRRLLL